MIHFDVAWDKTVRVSQASGANKAGRLGRCPSDRAKLARFGGPVQANCTVKLLNLSHLSYLTLVGHLNKVWSVILLGTLVGHLK